MLIQIEYTALVSVWVSAVINHETHHSESLLSVDRLFLGGYGTWSLALAAPDLFAAIIPICGGGDVQRVACLRHLPIWNFHGELDDVIPVERSLVLVKALDSPLCKLTVYPHLKHDSWTETYSNKEIFIWLLQQKKSPGRH